MRLTLILGSHTLTPKAQKLVEVVLRLRLSLRLRLRLRLRDQRQGQGPQRREDSNHFKMLLQLLLLFHPDHYNNNNKRSYFCIVPPPLFTFYVIINNNGVTNFSCWLHFHVGIIYYCYYIFSCSQNVNFVVVVRFCFLGESESTSKGLNETWYPFLLAVTNDFDLHNAIIVSSFTASGNINLPILGSTIKFFVVE